VTLREDQLLYFAYTGFVQPDRLADIAPDATFEFIAHLPEWGLGFPYKNGKTDGGLPSAHPEPGSTIWGAVFELTNSEAEAIKRAEKAEGRKPQQVEVMDRGGRRHEVMACFYSGKNGADHTPSDKYLRTMMEGARHWQLPAGWIAGIQEHLDNI